MMQIGAVVQLGEATTYLRAAAASVQDLRIFFRGVLDPAISKLLREQFETQGGVWGNGRWAPLSRTTILLRSQISKVKRGKDGRYLLGSGARTNRRGRARGGLTTPMQDSRRLWAAYTKGMAPESIRIINRQSYERGVSVPYAHYHQRAYPSVVFGHRTGKNVPARPVMPRTNNEIPAPISRAWGGLLETYLAMKLK